MNDSIQILRNEFSKKLFFVRIFEHNNKILIWNDHKIKMEIELSFIRDIIDDKIKLDEFTDVIIREMTKKIEKKYAEMKNRRVSVVIPNHNNEMYIKKTIDSILNNTYKDIEVIFVDDCSTDNTVKIVRENYGNDERVKIYENKVNRGAYYCRNKGILLSTGYYVTVVDGDDFIDSEKLEYEVTNLEKFNSEKESEDLKFWAYGTQFQRIYFEGNDINNVTHINKSNSFVFLFQRRLFNYLGYFQNNRFGADSEYAKRARMLGFRFYLDKKRLFYNAYTIAGKNLTQIHRAEERRDYIGKCSDIIKRKEYIEMALLDEKEHFLELIMNNKKK